MIAQLSTYRKVLFTGHKASSSVVQFLLLFLMFIVYNFLLLRLLFFTVVFPVRIRLILRVLTGNILLLDFGHHLFVLLVSSGPFPDMDLVGILPGFFVSLLSLFLKDPHALDLLLLRGFKGMLRIVRGLNRLYGHESLLLRSLLSQFAESSFILLQIHALLGHISERDDGSIDIIFDDRVDPLDR